jgi:hypothetical protein
VIRFLRGGTEINERRAAEILSEAAGAGNAPNDEH